MGKVLKGVGIRIGGLQALALMTMTGMNLAATARHNQVYDIEPETIVIPTDAACWGCWSSTGKRRIR